MTGDIDGLVKTLLVKVYGTVQGVGYRAACVQRARQLDLAGWVRNRLDGSVEALLQGAPESVSEMCDGMCDGMSVGLVDRMEVEELEPPVARFDAFRQIPDA
ncbi:acylphosphatase [Paraburkholderia sp. LEh10]|uniref:acylphosphatase n=1 Tax=Paraburkholderia sp. LEh10 TaxID=2821353 RepID=UPI001AE96E83|nr:acylphosphatase [Paraburkholderia sp. LEh10]MBP0596095.1 acylphosphatase [Paraburkholderia sp. LEh10]